MTDMMVIAFQADLTRVMTFLMTREGTSRAYREIGIADGHHPCTHHQQKPDLMEKVTQINEYHTSSSPAWLHKLKASKEGDSNLLDNSMIVYGAGLSDGNRHLTKTCRRCSSGAAAAPSSPDAGSIFRRETPMSNFLSP